MMKLNILMSILCFFLLSCQAEKKTNESASDPQEKQSVRDDLQKWIDKEFSDQDELKVAVEDLAKTPPESCEFKHKVDCIEKIVGFDQALEIELEMMRRVLNTPDRQERFDENIQKCHFGQGMNKQVCAHERNEN